MNQPTPPLPTATALPATGGTMHVLFVAGEPSGDVHAARIVERLRSEVPGVVCFGVGGPAMEKAGFEALLPFEPFNRMGFVEVCATLPFFLDAKRKVVEAARTRRPSAAVLIDYPGFNVRLLRALHRLNIPVLYYIAPKVWAWKRDRRAAILERCASTIATIFPFESDHYKPHSPRIRFVGNPVAEELDTKGPLPDRTRWNDEQARHNAHIGLIPGSRTQEVATILPVMIRAFAIVRSRFPGTQATVSRCPWLPDKLFDCCEGVEGVQVVPSPLATLLQSIDCALITSGTATLEAALRGVPHVIVYKTSAVSYRLYRAMLKTRWIGLPNIVAQREIVPERYQDDVNPDNLAGDIERFIETPHVYHTMASDLASLRSRLGSRRPSEEVVALLRELVRQRGVSPVNEQSTHSTTKKREHP